jgi:CubicO group peptidase (beta-lactamase class C family)
MHIKNLLIPSLFVGALLALTNRQFTRTAEPKTAQPKQASGNAPFDAIDAYVEEQMRRLNLPGVSLAIVKGQQIVHLRGFGRARPGGEAPSPKTPFFIGSLTKSFTALAVMQLVEAGQVELDAPLQRYLPWFRVADPQVSAQITVRHLLNQTSGLSVWPGWQLMSDYDDRPGVVERQARRLRTLKLSRPAGAGFEYSNSNYNLLGLVIEAASGEPYTEYIQNHIFRPLGMIHSYTTKAEAQQDGLAVGHRSWFGLPVPAQDLPVPSGCLPAGGLISSAGDMARYLIACLNGGRYAATQILSPQGIAEMHRPAVGTIKWDFKPGQYGMGWYIEEQNGTQVVEHSGMVPDSYAYMALLPEKKIGIILLININHFSMQMTLSEVGAGLTALLAGKEAPAIQFGALPWVQRSLLLIPVLQIADLLITLGLIRRWRQDPGRSRLRRRGRHILPSLIPNLLVSLSLIPVLGKLRGFLMLFAPDFSWIARISGSFALVWSLLRTWLVVRASRLDKAP